MATYLIDYENTGVKGLVGIEQLKEDDLIIIFYGPKTGAVPFDEHVKICQAASQVKYIKTTKTAKNYLDFQLTTYLGYLVGQTDVKEYYVISKDSGYDSVIDFWKKWGIRIVRKENIAEQKIAAKAATEATLRIRPLPASRIACAASIESTVSASTLSPIIRVTRSRLSASAASV